jgi:hypothetical protein
MFLLIWSAIGLGLLLALLTAAVRDRHNRRHGRRDRTGSEIWLDVRQQRRDSVKRFDTRMIARAAPAPIHSPILRLYRA